MSDEAVYDPEGERLRITSLLKDGFMPSSQGSVVKVGPDVARAALNNIEKQIGDDGHSSQVISGRFDIAHGGGPNEALEKLQLEAMLRQGYMPSGLGQVTKVSSAVAETMLRQLQQGDEISGPDLEL